MLFFVYLFFVEIEEDIDQTAIDYSLGMIRASGSAKIRVAPIDPKSKARISQTLQVCFFSAYFSLS
jgi:hypothetical protein